MSEGPQAEYVRRVKSKTKPRCVLTKEGADEIARLLSEGWSMEAAADKIGVSKSTLYAEHNRKLLDEAKRMGEVVMHDNIRVKQIELAMSGDVKMLIFLGKQYLGQSDHPAPVLVPVSPIPQFQDDLMRTILEADKEWKESEEYRAWEARTAREREEEARAHPNVPIGRAPGPDRAPSATRCCYNTHCTLLYMCNTLYVAWNRLRPSCPRSRWPPGSPRSS